MLDYEPELGARRLWIEVEVNFEGIARHGSECLHDPLKVLHPGTGCHGRPASGPAAAAGAVACAVCRAAFFGRSRRGFRLLAHGDSGSACAREPVADARDEHRKEQEDSETLAQKHCES
jgi:hypothetical protein